MTDPRSASRSRALLIAVDTYDDEAIPNLRTPRHDVAALAEVLNDPMIADFEINKLINPSVTRLGREIEEFFRSGRREDLMLLHFAGHGYLDEQNRLRFAARDTEVQYLATTALLSKNILEIAESGRSRRIMFIVDCCYSGRFFGALSARGSDSVHLGEQFPVHGKGTLVLAASGDLQYAFEDRDNSIFSKAIVEGLRSGAADIDRDGWISATDLYEYAYDRLRDSGTAQTPRLLGEYEGRLVIARARSPKPNFDVGPVPSATQPKRSYDVGRVPPPDRPKRPTIGTPSPRHSAESRDAFTSNPGHESIPPISPQAPRKKRASVPMPEAPAQSSDDTVSRQYGTVRLAVTGVLLVALAAGFIWLVVFLVSAVDIGGGMSLVLWLLAAILGIAGVLALFRRQILWGMTLIIVALLVGPGGVSIFS